MQPRSARPARDPKSAPTLQNRKSGPRATAMFCSTTWRSSNVLSSAEPHGFPRCRGTRERRDQPSARACAKVVGASDRPRPRGRLEDNAGERVGGRTGRTATSARTFPPPSRLPGRNRPRFLPWTDVGRSSGSRALRLSPASYFPPLPSPERGPVRCVEFVLDYRCGAAPEVRRVPF
jgi:hypothetical protein